MTPDARATSHLSDAPNRMETGKAQATARDAETERRLVEEFRRGDRAAFDELARRHLPALHRFALRLTGRAADAEDLLQDALLRALGGLARFRGEASVGTWLHRIVCNVHGSRRRADERRRAAEARAPVPEAAAEPGARDDEVVRRALDRLPPTQRAVLALRVYEGLQPAEIAGRLGLKPGAVRMNLLYARRTLAGFLAPRE